MPSGARGRKRKLERRKVIVLRKYSFGNCHPSRSEGSAFCSGLPRSARIARSEIVMSLLALCV